MKKRGLLAVILLITVLGSACGDVIVEPKWVIGVDGAEQAVFTSIDCARLNEVSLTIERTQPDGSVRSETLQGVRLKDVLDSLGVAQYSSVTLTARSGTSVSYDKAVVDDASTILATKADQKEVWEDGFIVLQAVAGNGQESLWLRGLVSLTVIP
ncbi:MAG: hypothetical protein ACOYI3_03585 [Christensenellales bacterium]|jgi:hypothetical protein